MGSRGSVIPFFMSIKDKGILPITDSRMTRFMITLDQGVNLVWHAFNDMVGGEIYVKKIPSMNIIDIAKAIAPKAKYKFIGIRPGEKLHEQMISTDEAHLTYEFKEYYKIVSTEKNLLIKKKKNKNRLGKKVDKNFMYASNTNKIWMKREELQKWIFNNYKEF